MTETESGCVCNECNKTVKNKYTLNAHLKVLHFYAFKLNNYISGVCAEIEYCIFIVHAGC